jgi:hypothetical protein
LTASGHGWAAGAPPPREGSAIEVLIDGEAALARIAEAIAGARSHVYLAGWCLSPEFALTTGDCPAILRQLLAETAARVPVRVLLWAGAPLPFYPVSRRKVRRVREELCRGNEVVCALDAHERPLHCHHEDLPAALLQTRRAPRRLRMLQPRASSHATWERISSTSEASCSSCSRSVSSLTLRPPSSIGSRRRRPLAASRQGRRRRHVALAGLHRRGQECRPVGQQVLEAGPGAGAPDLYEPDQPANP